MIWNSLIKTTKKLNGAQLKRFMSSEAFKLPAVGVNKAYDQAIEYLNKHSQNKLDQAEKVEEQLKDTKLDQSTKLELNTLREKLLTEAYINLPETQYKYQSGNYNIKEPVFKYLKAKEWNTQLKPIIKQRVEQMFVSPDVFHPNSEYLSSHIKLSVDGEGGDFIECGKFIDVEKTIQAPSLEINTFHEETKHYTLILMDVDYPNEKTKAYQQKAHWIIKNIPLSLTQTKVEGETLLNYIPPHPANGTGTHRYTFILLEQATNKVELGKFNNGEQALTQFINKNELIIKGTYFFRSKWSPAVTSIHNDILKIEEPLFGPKPIINPLVGKDGKLRGRYHNI